MKTTEFERWYWPVAALEEFCKLLKISASGRKAELRDRVAAALDGKVVPLSTARSAPGTCSFDWTKERLSDETIITETITFGINVRGYFKAKLGKRFVCHSDFMVWVKAHPGLTLHDAALAWKELEARKQDPDFRREIAECNNYLIYLRHIRDDNPTLSHNEAKHCWDQKKIRPAERGFVVYETSDLRFLN